MQGSRVLVTLVSLLALALLAGCGGEPPATPAPADSWSPTPSQSESSPEDGDASSAPTVEPASGEAMVTDTAFVRAPQRWRIEEFGFGILDALELRGEGVITLVDLGTVSSRSPRELARKGLRNFEGKPDLDYEAELGGAPAYRATGRDLSGFLVEYGAVRGGRGVILAFSFDGSRPIRKRQPLIDSVLASFVWN